MSRRLLDWSQRILAQWPKAARIPSSCALCGSSGDAEICNGCHLQFFSSYPHRCSQCAIPLNEASGIVCGACLKQPPSFDATIVATNYMPPIDQLVLALKFGGRLPLAPLFSRMLRDALLRGKIQEVGLPDLIMAIPLGRQRLEERGFNQALEIAKPLARDLGIPLAPRLASRTRETYAQSMLHPDERRKNIRDAFTVAHDAIDQLRDQHVGVVDDVLTTGETLSEMATTLKRFGAKRVTNFVFARTLPK